MENNNNNMENMDKLAIELLTTIFKKLNRETRLTCKEVCKLWLYVLMNFEEFASDRRVYFTDCIYSVNRPPISTFMKSKYKYLCEIMDINEINVKLDDNIPDTFWSDHVKVQQFGFEEKLYSIEYIDLVKLFEKIKNVKSFYFQKSTFISLLTSWKRLNDNKWVFEQIECLNFKCNPYHNDLKSKEFKHIFPNLKLINFDCLSARNKLLSNIKSLKFTININELYYIDHIYNAFINLPPSLEYKTVCKQIIQKSYQEELMDIEYDKKSINEVVKLETYQITSWNSKLDVKYLSIETSNYCFFKHDLVIAGNGIIDLTFKISKNLCTECLESLFRNLKNLKSMIIVAKQDVDFTIYLQIASKYCKNLIKLKLQNGYFEHNTGIFENVKTLHIKNNKSEYTNQLQNLYINYPKVNCVYIDDSFQINHPEKLVDLYSHIMMNNKNLVKLDIYTKNEKDNIFTDDLIDIITANGSKLRVSCVFFVF